MKGTLAHYGVLGMKWGVRRSEQPGYSKKPVYDTLQDSIKAGSVVYRVSGNKNEIDAGRTFIFTEEKDADNFAAKLKELSPSETKVFKLTLKVKKDLVGPSEQERVDAFLKNYEQTPIASLVSTVKDEVTRQGINFRDKDGNKTLTNYRAYTIAVSKNVNGIGDYANAQNYRKGFDMIRDDYQRGSTRLTKDDKTPIDSLDSAYLVFSRSQALKTISSEEVPNKSTAKHGAINNKDLYPGSSFFNPDFEIIFGKK